MIYLRKTKYKKILKFVGGLKLSEVTGSYHLVVTQADYPLPSFTILFVTTQYYKLSANWQDALIRTTYGFLHSADSISYSISCPNHVQIMSWGCCSKSDNNYVPKHRVITRGCIFIVWLKHGSQHIFNTHFTHTRQILWIFFDREFQCEASHQSKS